MFGSFSVHAWSSVEVRTRGFSIIGTLLVERTHFGMSRGAKMSLALRESM